VTAVDLSLPSQSFRCANRASPFPPRRSPGQETSTFGAACFSRKIGISVDHDVLSSSFGVTGPTSKICLHPTLRCVYPATCTSVTVSGVGVLDGTYEYESSGYYTRAGGTTTYEIEIYSGFWYLQNSPSTVVPQYRVSRGGWCPTAVAAVGGAYVECCPPVQLAASRHRRHFTLTTNHERAICMVGHASLATAAVACAESDHPKIPASFLG